MGEAPFTITQERFHLLGDEYSEIEDGPLNRAERAFTVEVEPGQEEYPVNSYDGYGIYNHDVNVKVSYQLTNMGDDTDTYTEQATSGDIRRVRDKADGDKHTITTCLCWHANWSNLDPAVIYIQAVQTPSLVVNRQTHMAVLTIPLKVQVSANIPGAYSID